MWILLGLLGSIFYAWLLSRNVMFWPQWAILLSILIWAVFLGFCLLRVNWRREI